MRGGLQETRRNVMKREEKRNKGVKSAINWLAKRMCHVQSLPFFVCHMMITRNGMQNK